VQLARDTGALASHREGDKRLLLGLELAGARAEFAHQLPPPAHLAAGPPGPERDERELDVREFAEAHADLQRDQEPGDTQQTRALGNVCPTRVREDRHEHLLQVGRELSRELRRGCGEEDNSLSEDRGQRVRSPCGHGNPERDDEDRGQQRVLHLWAREQLGDACRRQCGGEDEIRSWARHQPARCRALSHR